MFRRSIQTVMGHALPAPRITLRALALLVVLLLIPVLCLTGLADLCMQLFFGVCTGVWCLAGS